MNQTKILAFALMVAALTLACDLPFGLQQKIGQYVGPTPTQSGSGVSPLADASPTSDTNATPDTNATADANTTPGTPNASSTRRPAPTRVPPAVYVSSLRVDPPQPRSGPGPVTFFIRFQSTFTTKQTVKWLVKIYRPGETKSFGETAALTTDIPPGSSEIASANNWHTNPFQCEPFSARVYWFETGVFSDPLEFKKPDGANTPFVDFKVCP